MDKEILTNLITLLAVCLGWVLGEFTSFIKSFLKIRKLKAAIELELKDNAAWVGRNITTLEHMIAVSAIGEIPEFGIVPVPTHLFQKYYVEVAVDLTSSQRISFNSIHNLLNITELQFDNLQAIRQKCIYDTKYFGEYRDLLIGIYQNIAMLHTQINFHITEGSKLDVYALTAEDAKRVNSQIAERTQQIIDDAKKLDRKSIDEKYYC